MTIKKIFKDINLNYALTFGLADIVQRYRRSVLGPFWITISLGIMIAVIGVVFSTLFASSIDRYLPHLAIGLIFWNYFAQSISDASVIFNSTESLQQNIKINPLSHLVRLTVRNIQIFFHNFLIVPFIVIIFNLNYDFTAAYFYIGLFNLLCLTFSISIIVAIISVRYRDMQQITQNLLQILFYASPVIWYYDSIANPSIKKLLNFNPLVPILEMCRAPFFQVDLSMTLILGVLLFNLILAVMAFKIFSVTKDRIVFWL